MFYAAATVRLSRADVIVAADDLPVVLREEPAESLDRGMVMQNSQSPEVATRRHARASRLRVQSRQGEGRRFMHLKRVLTLMVLVAAAATLGKAGVNGSEKQTTQIATQMIAAGLTHLYFLPSVHGPGWKRSPMRRRRKIGMT